MTDELRVETFCRLATGTGFRVTHGGRPYAVFIHRFGKTDVTPLDGGPPPTAVAKQEIIGAAWSYLRGFDWQGARE